MRRIIAVAGLALLIASAGIASADETPPTAPTAAAVEPHPVVINQSKRFGIYPRDLLKKGISGDVLLQFRLDENGKAQDVKMILSEPKGAFDRAAKTIVSKLRFSVPPEWLATHPNRVIDFGILWLAGQCKVNDIFPGTESMTITGMWTDDETISPVTLNRWSDECTRLRESLSTTDQPTQ